MLKISKKLGFSQSAICVFVYLMLFSTLSAAEEQSPNELQEDSNKNGLTQALLELSVNHPRLKGQALKVAAAADGARYSFIKYPDPKLGISWMGPTSEIRLAQPIPFPGRLAIASQIDDLKVEQERLQLIIEKNRVGAEFLERLIEISYRQSALDFAIPYAHKVELLRNSLRARYSVGRGNLSDINKASVRLAKYEEKIVRLRGELDAALELLRYFWNSEEFIENTKSLAGREEVESYLSEVAQRLLETNGYRSELSPAVARLQIGVKREEKATTLAKMLYLPDFEVFAALRRDTLMGEGLTTRRGNMMGVGVTVRLPLWSAMTNHKNVSAHQKSAAAQQEMVTDLISYETVNFAALTRELKSDDERIELYNKKLLPEARRTLESSRTAYENDRVDFEAFLETWDLLFMLETEKLRLQADKNRRLLQQAKIVNLVLPDSKEKSNENK